jgi:hypothetical protein
MYVLGGLGSASQRCEEKLLRRACLLQKSFCPSRHAFDGAALSSDRGARGWRAPQSFSGNNKTSQPFVIN